MVGEAEGSRDKAQSQDKEAEGRGASRCWVACPCWLDQAAGPRFGCSLYTLFWELQLRVGVRGCTESGGRALPGSDLTHSPYPTPEGQVSPLILRPHLPCFPHLSPAMTFQMILSLTFHGGPSALSTAAAKA